MTRITRVMRGVSALVSTALQDTTNFQVQGSYLPAAEFRSNLFKPT